VWSNAFENSAVSVDSTHDGLVVSTDPLQQSYCVEYGPMRAARSGLHRFNVTCTTVQGGMSFSVLNEDRTAWIHASVNRHDGGERQRFEIAVDLANGQRFSILVSNQHPRADGVSKFIIHRLDGSDEPSLLLAGREPKRRWRRWASDRAADAWKKIGAMFGHRFSYRVARATPEFEAVVDARRVAHEQLQALAPLQYLGDFHKFLRERRPDNLHVNGCGDFQLMAREHWDELRAYPEFETFSMNIDGLFSYTADAAGIKEQLLEPAIYHLEHEVGSGWSPEGEALLRKRIAERGITWLDASTVYIWAAYMGWLGRPMIFNGSAWGFGDMVLPETSHVPSADTTAR
jgi:hypothetical protein